MRTLALFVCAIALWAATPLDGTWRLNRSKSTMDGALPSFMHDDTLNFRPGGPGAPAVPPSSFVARDGRGEKNLYRVEVSPGQRTLTVTRIQSFEDQSGKQFHTVLVLEKQ